MPEEDRKPKDKVFFCDKYTTFQKFLDFNKMRQIGNQQTPHKVFNKLMVLETIIE